jgi:Domain of unknown function (DUF4160)
MPELVRFSNCKICVYADSERHGRPHFHIRGKGWEVSVCLQGLTLIIGKGCAADIDEALQWAKQEENLEYLREKWKELNERD